MTRQTRAELALIGVTAIWGASFTLVQSAIREVPTMVFLALRFIVATIALGLLFGPKLRAHPERRAVSLRGGFLAGVCLMGGYVFQTFGLHHTTPSKSAFITGLTSVLVPFLSAAVYRKAPRLFEAIGVAVATLGLGLLTLHPERFTIGHGDTITLFCTVAFACHILVLGRFSAVSSFELLSFTQIAVTAALSLVAAPWVEPMSFVLSTRVVAAVFFTGLLATALAFSVQTYAQRHTTPTRAALIFTLEPVWAVVTSYLVAGEVLAWRGWAGAALILTGVLLVELKPATTAGHPLD